MRRRALFRVALALAPLLVPTAACHWIASYRSGTAAAADDGSLADAIGGGPREGGTIDGGPAGDDAPAAEQVYYAIHGTLLSERTQGLVVYAVGTAGTIVAYDEQDPSWQEVVVPADTGRDTYDLLAIWASDGSALHVVGQTPERTAGYLLELTGGSGSRDFSMSRNMTPAKWWPTAVDGHIANDNSPPDVWAAGWSSSGGQGWAWQNPHFTGSPSPFLPYQAEAVTVGSGDTTAVGRGGKSHSISGTTPTELSSPFTNDLRGVWRDEASGRRVAVGHGGAMLELAAGNTAWTPMTPYTSMSAPSWRAVHGISTTQIFAVGLGGAIARYDGTQWEPCTAADPAVKLPDLHGVWSAPPENGSDDVRIFLAGAQGFVAMCEVPAPAPCMLQSCNWK